MSIKAMKQALEALETLNSGDSYKTHNAATALRQAIAEAEKQEPVDETAKDRHEFVKFRRGDILRCIETEELCTVWATSTSGKTLVTWGGNDFTEYTAEQIGELFWLEPESRDVEDKLKEKNYG